MASHPTSNIRSAASVAHLLKVHSAVDAMGASSLRRLLVSTEIHDLTDSGTLPPQVTAQSSA